MKIRGKEYMEVKDRVMIFRKNHPSWALITEIIENDEKTGSVIFKVIVQDEEGRIRGTGHAHEFKDDKSSMVNKTSHLENCETSAIGRALASIGIGIESSYATYDEVMIALDKQDREEEESGDPIKEGKIRQSTDNPLPKKESSVKVIPDWRMHSLNKGKYDGMTLGEIAEIPAKGKEGSGISYIQWMSGLEIQDPKLRVALDEAIKQLGKNGRQGFEQVG